MLLRVVYCPTRWRNLWKFVPGLNLDNHYFPDYNTFLCFVARFLDLNSESRLQRFKLNYDCDGDYEPEIGLIRRWINAVVRLKVKHVDVLDDSGDSYEIHMPPTIYTCESLVSLKLCGLTLPSPNFVSLPSLKVISLTIVHFSDDSALESLISVCPILETLFIDRSICDDIEVLRVRSQSLLNFSHFATGSDDLEEDLVVTIDAPRLKYLRLSDGRIANFILNHLGSLVKADINTEFTLYYGKKFNPNDLPKRKMIRDFIVGISRVKDMIISSTTLEIIYDLFKIWEMLPVFLDKCPIVKSLVLGSSRYQEKGEINILSESRCFLSSLEYVEIERPLKGDAKEMELVSYLLEKSTILKKIVLCLDDNSKGKEDSAILKKLIAIPRLSSMCHVVVL